MVVCGGSWFMRPHKSQPVNHHELFGLPNSSAVYEILNLASWAHSYHANIAWFPSEFRMYLNPSSTRVHLSWDMLVRWLNWHLIEMSWFSTAFHFPSSTNPNRFKPVQCCFSLPPQGNQAPTGSKEFFDLAGWVLNISQLTCQRNFCYQNNSSGGLPVKSEVPPLCVNVTWERHY